MGEGDSLGWLADGARPRALPMPSERILDCAGDARLELILGAQIGAFPAMSLFDAFNGDWQVDTRADRMGVRLLGPRLAQCLPGQRVRLLPTVQEAAHREHRRLLAAWDA
ncbi:hypothetical protein F7O94_24895 [Pseudomonas aeruginosa]|nr:hypothetical protein F7O94_24895 [Pseudomonas aeruginosa]